MTLNAATQNAATTLLSNASTLGPGTSPTVTAVAIGVS
jgi:hypothetical protein